MIAHPIDDRATVPYGIERYPTREAWLEGRRGGLGASDAAVVLGVSPWSSPMQLYAEKTGALPLSTDQTEAMEWGLRLEPALALKYEEVTGRPLADLGDGFPIFRSLRHPFMAATPDRLILGDPRGIAPLQLKAVSAFKADEWAEEPPLEYQVQVQQEIAVLGTAWGVLAVLIGGQRFRYYECERNERFIAGLIAQEEAFWLQVQRRQPPALDGSDATAAVLKQLHPRVTDPGRYVELGPEFALIDAERVDAAETIKRAQAQKQEAENKLRAAIGDAEGAILPNGTRYTLKEITKQSYVVKEQRYRELRRYEAK